MLKSKSRMQKLFEKTAMIKQNKETKLMIAKSGSDDYQLILCLTDEKGTVIPLCKLLSQKDLDSLEPLFDETEKEELNPKFEKFLLSLNGWENFSISEWNNLGQSPDCYTPFEENLDGILF